MKKIVVPIAIILSLIGIWASLPSASKTSTSNINKTAVPMVAEESDLVIGSREALATITEYADFKCPSCGQFHQTSGKQLRLEYGSTDKLKIIFRPMAVIGPDSERAADGAYCAHDQGKFIGYHDAVYDYMWDNYYKARDYSAEYKDILTLDVLTDISKNVGLDSTIFINCIENGNKSSFVSGNQSKGQAIGVRGTPSFSINGQLVVGPQPVEVFKKLIDIQL